MKRGYAIGFLAVAAGLCAGCGNPQYAFKPTEVANQAEFSWSLFSKNFKITNAVGTRTIIKGLKVNPATREMELDELTYEADPVSVWKEMPAQAASWAMMVDAQTRLFAQHGANFNSGLDALGRNFGPLLSQYIGARQAVETAKINRPRLIAEVLTAVTSGGVDAQALYEKLPPDIVSAVVAAGGPMQIISPK